MPHPRELSAHARQLHVTVHRADWEPRELYLLANVLDALDRLYDRQMAVVDLHALLAATAAAVQTGPAVPQLAAAELALRQLVAADDRDAALAMTDDLRGTLAGLDLP